MEQLLDELEDLIHRGIHVPGGGKILVDGGTAQGILEQMREGLADEAQHSQRLTAEHDRIVNEARAEARRIVEEAQAQVQSRVDDQALVQMARQRAREIQTEAEQRAASLRAETNSYVANQLNGLENRIQHLLREVQAGQRALSQEHPKRTDTA